MILFHLHLIDKLTEIKQQLENTIIEGQIQNYESYKFFIGRIQGLKDAIDIIKDTVKGGYTDA
jgi:hypothetical protein